MKVTFTGIALGVVVLLAFGLLGALIDHLGAWLYGWQPVGVGYWIGLLVGLVAGFVTCAVYIEEH